MLSCQPLFTLLRFNRLWTLHPTTFEQDYRYCSLPSFPICEPLISLFPLSSCCVPWGNTLPRPVSEPNMFLPEVLQQTQAWEKHTEEPFITVCFTVHSIESLTALRWVWGSPDWL